MRHNKHMEGEHLQGNFQRGQAGNDQTENWNKLWVELFDVDMGMQCFTCQASWRICWIILGPTSWADFRGTHYKCKV